MSLMKTWTKIWINIHMFISLTSRVKMDYIHRDEQFPKSIRSKVFLTENAAGYSVSSSLEASSLHIFENSKYKQVKIFQNVGLLDYNKQTDHESENKLNFPLASNTTEKISNDLSSGQVEQKVIAFTSQSHKSSVCSNKSIDTLRNSVYSTPMYFGTKNSSVVATQRGATAYISCVVHHIGECVMLSLSSFSVYRNLADTAGETNKQIFYFLKAQFSKRERKKVSWIRKKDYHLLTVGLNAYSSDERFTATHLKHSEDWTLQIKFVQQRDEGVYECQVSTHPPTSIFLTLLVVEARAEISGPHIRYLTPGSTLRLQCHVVQNTHNSEFIFWYHDNRMINYDMDRGINVSTDPDFQSSELTISRTRREHSGNYTCVASNTQPASVLIHIFKGDNPAAMYHGHVGSTLTSHRTQLLHILLTAAVIIDNSYIKNK